MTERTELLKKAVLTGVGATTNVERVKSALSEALEDLSKVGSELIEDLEAKGKDKTQSLESTLKNFKEEVNKRKGDLEGQVYSAIRKAIKEFGLITRDDLEDISERLDNIEDSLTDGSEGSTTIRKKSRKSTSSK